MVRINFILWSNSPGKPSPVNVVMRWDGQRLVIPSGERIDRRNWSDVSQRVKKGMAGSADFNMHLTNVQQGIEKAYRATREQLSREPSIQELREAIDTELHGKDAIASPDLLQFIQDFIERSAGRINPSSGKQLACTTIQKYTTTLSHLREFLKKKRGRTEFASIDLQFYDRFTKFLTIEKKMATNSVGKYIQTLKTFLRAAEEDGCDTNPVYRTRRFHTPNEETDKVYLNESELNDLFHLNLSSIKRLERVRDLFLIGAWTGLRFSDFTTIQPENVKGDTIRLSTQKTGQMVEIPMHKTVRAVIARYEGKYANPLPPAISNQKMNEYLREVSQRVPSLQTPVMITATKGGQRQTTTKRKWELITTHTARRSFASNMYRAGCPTRSIMAITGHQTESAFRAYIRLSGEEHANIVRTFMNQTAPLRAVK